MTATDAQRLTAKRIGGTFFAEVTGVVLARDLDAAWDAIHTAYLEHKILAFHGQDLTAKQFHDFGARFGLIEPHTVSMYHHEAFPGITVLSNRFELGRPKGIRDAGSHWHSDYSYKAIPANVTMLYALEVPEEGGDTKFVDLAAAYRALPEATKQRLDGLNAPCTTTATPRTTITRKAAGGCFRRRSGRRRRRSSIPSYAAIRNPARRRFSFSRA
jgi:taurine dioxygenase